MKILIFFLYIYISCATFAFSETIKKVEVIGNERVSKETIVLFSEINLNEDLDGNKLNKALKNIYNSNFFENVNLEIKNNTLIIEVKEYPIIQIINIEGIKKQSLIDILKDEIQLKEKSSLNKNLLKKDVNKIKNILRGAGFYFSEIKTKINNNKNNTVDIVYEINLGNKAHIKKIKFMGDKKIKDRKLKNIIVSEESKFWKFISKKKYLDINRIKLDKNLLKNYYKNNGYFNVLIESSSAKITNENNFELIFKIDAGNKYFFNNLKLELPSDYPRQDFTKIDKILDELTGELYSLNKINKILKIIDNIAAQKSYEFIDATYNEAITNGNKINLTLKIVEGEKYYVDKINIFGNYITEEKVIRNTLLVDEGDAFNNILYNKSINQIKSKNLFDKVIPKLETNEEKKLKVINIEVQEKPTGEIFAGVGTGTAGTNLGAGIKERNFGGRGIILDSNFNISDTDVRGSFSVENPNFRDSDRSVKTTIESTSTDLMKTQGYKNNRTGFSFGTSFEQYENIYFSPALSTYYEKLETSSKASAAKRKQDGNYFETLFNYGLTLNKLNQNFQPSEGYKSSFLQTVPLISDDLTLQNTYKFEQYFKLVDDMVFSYSFFGKASNSLSGEDVRVTKRIRIPSRRLRGFVSGKVGPRDGGDYIGGNYGAALNVKTTLPQFFPDLQNIDFNVFYDAANVWGVDYNSSLDSSKIRSSAGLAVDWFTPIGPLSISFAHPITKADGDKIETFRFNIGTSF